jgi:heat shock protein HtpX
MLLTMFLLGVIYLIFLAVISYLFRSAIVSLAFVALFMGIQYFYSDKIALMSMGAKEVSESQAPKLHDTINRLCAVADLPKPRVAVVKTEVPNAFATGRNQKSAVVAVTTGLLGRLNQEELEAVLAHELTHVKNRDVMVITIASFLSTVASFIAQNFFWMGDRRDRDSGNFFLVLIVSIAVYILSTLLILALSRYREYAADRGAAVITGKPSNLVSALRKISGAMSKVPQEDLRAVEKKGMNAFFIIPAISSSSFMKLLSTHPALEDRIAALEKIEAEMA